MKKTNYRWIIHVLFAIYMAVLFKLTLVRDIPQRELNWHLFREYARFWQNHSWWHLVYFFAGNIVAFIPFGAYLGYRGMRGVLAVFSGFMLSLFIETMQYVWSVGVSELDDLILNTLGTLIGVAAVALVKKKLGKKGGQDT